MLATKRLLDSKLVPHVLVAGAKDELARVVFYRTFKRVPRYVDDGNHRFSASLTQRQDLVTRLGWTDEGVVFCGVQ